MTLHDDQLLALAKKLEALTEELRLSHLELVRVTTKTTGEVKTHERILDRLAHDVDDLQRELRALRKDLDAWETRGSKWGEQLDMSVAELQSRVSTKDSGNFGRNTAYITTAISVLVTILVTLFHFFGA
jgi:hypothetical protein